MKWLNLATFIENAARLSPDKTYLIDGEQKFTFAQVDADASRFANVLIGLGAEAGQKVALLLPNSGTFVACYYGILKAGMIPVPLHVTSPGPEVAQCLMDSGAVVLVAVESFSRAALDGFRSTETCRHLLIANQPDSEACPDGAVPLSSLMAAASDRFTPVQTRPEDPAAILYTAGTTGLSKGVVLSHSNYDFFTNFLITDFWGIRSDDVILMVAPASHIFGQSMLNVSCNSQATLTLMSKFEPEAFLRAIERDSVTFFAGVPTLLYFMLNSPLVDQYDIRSLRRVMVGGAPLHPDVAKRFVERFRVELITGYGLTEGIPVYYLNAEMYMKAPIGTVGLPARGTTVRVVNAEGKDVPPGTSGEIIVRGPQMFLHYHNRPEETSAAWRDGWFHTGDIGYMDSQGYGFIVDRLKDMIKRGGYAVSPAEVERALLTHPAIAEAAVIGVPHESLGEEIKAFVVFKPGLQATSGELIDYCKSHLAAYKYPRLIEAVDGLPKNATGKVLRRVLRGQA